MNITRFTTDVGEVVGIELTCSDFDGEFTVRYSNRCSPGCEEGMKIFFSPKLRGSSIHANVCAGRLEFVQKQSREWWARKAGSVLGWDESTIREQTDPEWALRMSNKRTIERYRKSSPREHFCISCGKKVGKGFDLCAECIEGGVVNENVGSPSDIDF